MRSGVGSRRSPGYVAFAGCSLTTPVALEWLQILVDYPQVKRLQLWISAGTGLGHPR
jgi:hypothetical protein